MGRVGSSNFSSSYTSKTSSVSGDRFLKGPYGKELIADFFYITFANLFYLIPFRIKTILEHLYQFMGFEGTTGQCFVTMVNIMLHKIKPNLQSNICDKILNRDDIDFCCISMRTFKHLFFYYTLSL